MGAERTVKVIIYIEIVMYVLSILMIAAFLIFAATLEDWLVDQIESDPSQHEKTRDALKTFFVFMIVFLAIVMLLSLGYLLLLVFGHKQRNLCKLKAWFYIGIFGAIITVLSILGSLGGGKKPLEVIIPSIVSLCYRIWTLVMVKTFINEIETGAPPPFHSVQYAAA